MKKCYRSNVAVIVLDRHGRILACERKDYPGTWQIPQGGIDPGETPKYAALRELQEELGTCAGEILSGLSRKIRYDWPRKLWRDGFCGQEQSYFLFRLSPWAKIDLQRAHRKDPALRQEFQRAEFLPLEEFLRRSTSFKKDAYKKALKEFEVRFPEIFCRQRSSRSRKERL